MRAVSSICFYSNVLQYSQAEDAQEKYPVCLTPITWQLQTTTTRETERARCPHAAVDLRLSAAAVTGWLKLCVKSVVHRSYAVTPVKRLENTSQKLSQMRCLCTGSRSLCCDCTVGRFKGMQGCGNDSLRAWLWLCKASWSPGNARKTAGRFTLSENCT